MKRSKAMRGKFRGMFVGRKSGKARQVNQYDRDGNFIKTWYATTEIQSELGLSYTNVVKCCTGHQKTAGGYIWQYADDDSHVSEIVHSLREPKHLSEAHKDAIRRGVLMAKHRLCLEHR